MMNIRVMFVSGAEIVVNDVTDDEVRIVKIQKKKDKIKSIWIRTESEVICINKKEVTLISYINVSDDSVKNTNVSSGLYQ